MGDGGVGSGSVDSGCHQLSENIWFVWSKMSYSGDMEGCHACARTTDGQRNVKIGLEFWKQNSQYICTNVFLKMYLSKCICQIVLVKMYFFVSLHISDQMSQRSEVSRIAL